MPIKYEKRCSVCKLSKYDKQLKKRILNSTKFNEWGIESLATIGKDYAGAFHYNSLIKHANDHIILNAAERTVLDAKLMPEKIKQQVVESRPKEAPVQQLVRNEDEVFDTVIEQGLERLKSGEMEITANHLLKAADSKANLGLKRKDQQLKIQEMIWHFASGQAEGNRAYEQRLIEGEEATAYDPAAITARNTDAGEARPDTVHQSVTWDAIAQGAGEISPPHTDGTDQAA